MLLAGLLASLAFASVPVQVDSADGPCGPEIEQALASRLAPAAPDSRPDRAHVWRRDGLLHVELVNPDGAILAARTLVERGSCAETAELVAVVVASWESDVHPAFTEQPANMVAAARASAESPPRTTGPRPRSASFDIALGGGPSLASSIVLAGAASLLWIPRGSGFGLRLSALADRQRSLSLGEGQAAWSRWMLGAEADWRSSRGGTSLDLHAGVLLGRLSVAGHRFEVNQSHASVSPALVLGSRVAWWANRRLAVWLDILSALSLRSQSIYALPGRDEQKLPVFQGVALVGVALGRGGVAR